MQLLFVLFPTPRSGIGFRGYAKLKLGDLALTSHSFRREGASTLLHMGMPLADIAVHGRWASESSCRDYLKRGEVFMLRFQSSLQPSIWGNILTLSRAVLPLLSACESCWRSTGSSGRVFPFCSAFQNRSDAWSTGRLGAL